MYIWRVEILRVWPRNGNMLGGQEVNITGPCFENYPVFRCRWGDWFGAPVTIGETPIYGFGSDTGTINVLKGRCIVPQMYYTGRLNLSVSFDDGNTYPWRSEFNIGQFIFSAIKLSFFFSINICL